MLSGNRDEVKGHHTSIEGDADVPRAMVSVIARQKLPAVTATLSYCKERDTVYAIWGPVDCRQEIPGPDLDQITFTEDTP